jgi:glycosyltransferase involved in cell wall biosynthesis
MNKKSDAFVSVVLVTSNDGDIVSEVLPSLQSYLVRHFSDCEIVVIDQRSKDNTRGTIEGIMSRMSSIRLITLSGPVRRDVALAAGLENAIGDFVVLFSLQDDPIECILDLVECCRAGNDVVVGVSDLHASVAYRLVRPLMRRVIRGIGYDIPRNATDLRCLSRGAVNAVTRAGKFHHQLFVRIHKIGYPSAIYTYIQRRGGGAKKTLIHGIGDGLQLLVFNSTKPLRWMSALGIAASGLIFTVTLAYAWQAHSSDSGLPAWAPSMLFLSAMFGLIFVMLAFLGEYLGRLLDEQDDHQIYSVISEQTSDVMLEEDRINVIVDSPTVVTRSRGKSDAI